MDVPMICVVILVCMQFFVDISILASVDLLGEILHPGDLVLVSKTIKELRNVSWKRKRPLSSVV